MQARSLIRRQVATVIGGIALTLGGGQAFGAAFALQEYSGSGIGNAFAGGAASAEDASTIWANPAGMSKLPTLQIVGALNVITPSIKFRNDGSQAAALQPLGNSGGDAGTVNYLPALYFNLPVNRQWNVGVGINAPFGLVTDYNDSWIGRFQGIKSDVRTINVNPAVSWKVTDQFAVGAGIDWQRIDAEFTSAVNYSGAIAGGAQQAAALGLISPTQAGQIIAASGGLQTFSRVKGNDSAWGWNIGALWDLTPDTRIGAQYRSSIKYHISGNVSLDNPAVPSFVQPIAALVNADPRLANGGVTANVKLPDIANVSIFSRLNDRWDVMADAQLTRWSTFKDLTFVRTTGAILQSTPENFDDAWRVSVGANYRWTDAWMFRGGVAWDQTPVNNADRTVRVPDGNRYWLSAGAQYKFNRNLKLDGGFTYVFVDKVDINQSAGSIAGNGLVNGRYDASSVSIISAQLTYSF